MADVPSSSPFPYASSSSSTPPRRPRTPDGGGIRRTSSSASGLAALGRRQSSTQVRIDQILETALARAETRSSGSEPRRSTTQPQSQPEGQERNSQEEQGQPRMEPLLRGASRPGPIPEHDGDAATESTHFGQGAGSSGSNAQQPNYQSTSVRSRRGPSTINDAPQTNGVDAAEGNVSQNGSARNGVFAGLKNTLASWGSVELVNKGSVARDHLALERTFLAWLRTSVSFASIGIAVTQLFRLNTSLNSDNVKTPTPDQDELRRLGKPLGATFLGISILILFLGYSRYVRSQKWIMTGRFPASRGTVILVTILTFAVMVASLVIVVQFSPGTG